MTGNSTRIVKGLQHFICGETGCKVENNCSLTRLHKCFWTIKTGKWWLGSSSPDMAAVIHLWPDLAFVKVEDSRKSQVLTRVVQGADYFPSIFSDDCEFHLRSGVSLSLDRRSSQGASLREHLFIEIDKNSGSAWWWWNITSLVFDVLNVTSQPNWVLRSRSEERLAARFWLSSIFQVHLYTIVPSV